MKVQRGNYFWKTEIRIHVLWLEKIHSPQSGFIFCLVYWIIGCPVNVKSFDPEPPASQDILKSVSEWFCTNHISIASIPHDAFLGPGVPLLSNSCVILLFQHLLTFWTFCSPFLIFHIILSVRDMGCSVMPSCFDFIFIISYHPTSLVFNSYHSLYSYLL